MLEAALGTAVDPALLELALTHRSYAYEHGGLPTNERLEFLGDSVLGVLVTDTLFRDHPDQPEGELAKLRAAVVNTRALAGVARRLELGRWLRLGRGEETTGGRDKNSILADTMEALIGAVYLDRGLGAAGQLVAELFGPLLEAASGPGAATDYKTALQELTASRGLGAPEYEVSESGPDHAKRFVARVLLAGRCRGQGEAGSKKHAEQRAARAAHQQISREPDGGPATPAPDGPSGPQVAGQDA